MKSPDVDQRMTVAVLAHGTGSTSDFLRRAFTPRDLGVDMVIALDDRTGDSERVRVAIDDAVRSAQAQNFEVEVVGGVSLGAHACALWAADPRAAGIRPRAGIVLALPAWTGAPSSIAGFTAAAAHEISAEGIHRAVASLRATAPADWVTDELARAWPRYSADELVACLRASSTSHAPDVMQLRSLDVAVGVVALADDPLHPLSVAEEWTRAIPRSALRIVARDLSGAGVDAIGRAARDALNAAIGSTASESQ